MWHVWFRRRGTQTWRLAQPTTERRARHIAWWLTAIGWEVQVRQGSWVD